MQKLEIERYLEKEFEEYLILRSPKVIGEKKKDNTLLTNWVEDLQGNEIVCADDQFFCATHIDNIVEMYYRVKEKGLKGIYNVCAKTTYTRLEMAEILAEKMRIKPKIKKVKISEFEFPDKRPLDCSMSSEKLTSEIKYRFKTIEETCIKIANNN